MTEAQAIPTVGAPRPTFRGSLAGQRPRVLGALGYDPWLVVAVATLLGLSVTMVFNVSYFWGQERFGDPLYFFRRHVVSILLGLVVAFVLSRVPSEWYRRAAYPLLLGMLVALVLVLVPGIGVRRSGAQRWLDLGPLHLQPSELAKLAVVLYLAHSITRKGVRMRGFTMGVLPHCVVVGALAGLVLLEPDFGTAVLSGALLLAMLFVGGARLAHLGLLATAALPLVAYGVLQAGYRMRRLFAFWNPDQDPLGMGHQLRQSFIAFGSGGLWGVGLGESQQKMFYLPAAHTDFIFSVIGEELGLAGAILVLTLFGIVAWRGFRIALRHRDEFASLLAFGLTLLLVLQAAVNVGVVLGCLPTKGLALPFVSYGGSALIAALAEVGILLALAREAG